MANISASKRTYFVGIDPGVTNYGIVGLDQHGLLVYARMLNNTIKSMAQDKTYMRKRYRKAILSIIKGLRPRELMAENFTVRGFGTNLIELVGIMLGSLQAYCSMLGIEEQTVMPSSWKREFDKTFGEDSLKKLYDQARVFGVPPHIVDAMCLALYLKDQRSFSNTTWLLLRINVKRASRLMQPDKKIKPKRVRHGVSGSKDSNRRRVSKPKLLVLASKRKK